MSNNRQTAVEWLASELSNHLEMPHKYFIEILDQAKEMEIAGKEMSYAEGYAEGYKRSLELIEWMIKTELKRNNVHESVNEQQL
jgi:hypothetical protein